MRAELNVNKLDKDDAVTKELKGTVSYKSKVDYLELVRTLSNNTKTPLGDYNPDFCYAINSTEGNKIFLVVEAKGYKSSTAIPVDEKGKIDFVKKYFEALAEHYKDQNIKISFKERINKTQLAALIKS
jgi:type III restriction enzyme